MKTPDMTRRQWQVAAYLALGDEPRGIAHKLGVTVRTVDYHVAAIYVRVRSAHNRPRIQNRVELIRAAGLWGVADDDLYRIAATGQRGEAVTA